jgi:hypothetical protein
MKLVLLPLLFCGIVAQGQLNTDEPLLARTSMNNTIQQQAIPVAAPEGKIKIAKTNRWRLDKNKIITGALLFTSGAAKGFNEGLQYKYRGFENIFPKANDQWFYPTFSYLNKYKDNDPGKGAKFPLSTSVLVMFTDQYHLNNFIQRTALTSALVIKIGEGKKSLKHYLLDIVYYTICYQVGFHTMYYPISIRE